MLVEGLNGNVAVESCICYSFWPTESGGSSFGASVVPAVKEHDRDNAYEASFLT